MTPAIRVHIDGGARGNPGPAGLGAHITDAEGVLLAELYAFLGRATNNVAEYAALVVALEWLVEHDHRTVDLFSDSQLLVRQFNGQYKVKNAGLRPLYERSRSLARKLSRVRVRHVRREENREADALANRAMDEQSGNIASPL